MAKRKNRNAKVETQKAIATEKTAPKTVGRGFLGASLSRFNSDYTTSHSITIDLRDGLRILRERSRGLSINNEFARRYLKLIKTNIVGPEGVTISVQALREDGKTPDSANDRIEQQFDEWGTCEHCTVTGKYNWRKAQELVLETVARDGECLVWLRRGQEFGKFYFQIQVLEADHLDDTYNTITESGNSVIQGVELNAYGRPIAYHIWQRNPSDYSITAVVANKRLRVLKEDLLHLYDIERASQERGFPWIASAMESLFHIGKYRESTLVAAREAANKQVYYKQTDNVPFNGEDEPDDMGNITLESSPGQAQILPIGWDVEHVDWNMPSTSFGEFQKQVMRPAAAGMGVSYNALSGDLESVNYSSARFGGLEDQSSYRSVQQWFINSFVKVVYEEWLKMQLLTDRWNMRIPLDKFSKFANVDYQARTWKSVDPIKDLNADIGAIAAGITSLSDVIRKNGRDPDVVMKERQKEKILMQQMDITPVDVMKTLAEINQINAANDAAATAGSDGTP